MVEDEAVVVADSVGVEAQGAARNLLHSRVFFSIIETSVRYCLSVPGSKLAWRCGVQREHIWEECIDDARTCQGKSSRVGKITVDDRSGES